MTYRPAIPHDTKMAVCRRQRHLCACGCGQPLLFGQTQFDHAPALMNRPFDDGTKTYVPDANDPGFIDGMTDRCHKTKTFGPGGELRITTRGSDIGEKAREGAIAEIHAGHRTYMGSKVCGQPRPRKNTFGRKPSSTRGTPA